MHLQYGNPRGVHTSFGSQIPNKVESKYDMHKEHVVANWYPRLVDSPKMWQKTTERSNHDS